MIKSQTNRGAGFFCRIWCWLMPARDFLALPYDKTQGMHCSWGFLSLSVWLTHRAEQWGQKGSAGAGEWSDGCWYPHVCIPVWFISAELLHPHLYPSRDVCPFWGVGFQCSPSRYGPLYMQQGTCPSLNYCLELWKQKNWVVEGAVCFQSRIRNVNSSSSSAPAAVFPIIITTFPVVLMTFYGALWLDINHKLQQH